MFVLDNLCFASRNFFYREVRFVGIETFLKFPKISIAALCVIEREEDS